MEIYNADGCLPKAKMPELQSQMEQVTNTSLKLRQKMYNLEDERLFQK